MDETFNTGLNLNECTVVSHNDYAALDVVAHFDCLVKSVPGMGKELLNAESDALLLVVEVEDNDFDVLVELNHFAGIGNAAPGKVSDVNEAVYAAKVNKHAVRSDVLDFAFEHLAFFELRNDFTLLSLELCLDEGFV